MHKPRVELRGKGLVKWPFSTYLVKVFTKGKGVKNPRKSVHVVCVQRLNPFNFFFICCK